MPYNSYSHQNSSMDSPLPPHPSHHDPAATYAATRRRGSTSQMCLHRILTTIATVPPPAPLPAAKPSLLVPEAEKADAADGASKCSWLELNSSEAKESLSSSSSGGGGSDVDHEDGGDRAERSLTLLIEAARLIFGEFVDGDESELKERNGFELKKDDIAAAEIGGEFDETAPSPGVRSKRGRTRVLPCRYRDSVLEPLTRFSRTGSTVIPAKRRRR